MKTKILHVVTVVLVALTVGCSARIASSVAQECSDQLNLAEAELNKAQAEGLGEAVSITKAASLLAAAAVQKQFEAYAGCIDKSQRARAFIADATRAKK
jgi:hypothetical protein